jgi:hypothetical protein
MNSTEPLLDRTYKLLEATKLTYEEIATGANVKFDWLAKFKQRHIGEPGVSKVQAVHDFLVSNSAGDKHP